jgi:hypothetical protein
MREISFAARLSEWDCTLPPSFVLKRAPARRLYPPRGVPSGCIVGRIGGGGASGGGAPATAGAGLISGVVARVTAGARSGGTAEGRAGGTAEGRAGGTAEGRIIAEVGAGVTARPGAQVIAGFGARIVAAVAAVAAAGAVVADPAASAGLGEADDVRACPTRSADSPAGAALSRPAGANGARASPNRSLDRRDVVSSPKARSENSRRRHTSNSAVTTHTKTRTMTRITCASTSAELDQRFPLRLEV